MDLPFDVDGAASLNDSTLSYAATEAQTAFSNSLFVPFVGRAKAYVRSRLKELQQTEGFKKKEVRPSTLCLKKLLARQPVTR
jgi:hypothetical protein